MALLSSEAELAERLNYLAQKVGLVFGIHLGVEASGDRLVFVDANRETITDDGDLIVAATKEEIEKGTVFHHFWDRAGHAALIEKDLQLGRSRGDP